MGDGGAVGLELAARAAATTTRAELALAGYETVTVRQGDGRDGWPEAAPFAAILVTAAPLDVPEIYKEQLADGGRLVIPVGWEDQVLLRITRRGDEFAEDVVHKENGGASAGAPPRSAPFRSVDDGSSGRGCYLTSVALLMALSSRPSS